MKKLIAVILALLMLFGCVQEEPQEIEIPESTNAVPEVYLGDDNVGITKFGYDWDVDNGDGTHSNTISCGIHPLSAEEIEKIHLFSGRSAKLVFEEKPVSYEFIRYEVGEETRTKPYEYTGNEVFQTVETVEDEFEISCDGKTYVYVLDVKYKNGNCQYAFELYSPKPSVERFLLADIMEDGKLLLAKESGGLSILSVGDTPIFLDGEPADISVIADGMQIQIKHSGHMLTSYPGQFGGAFEIHVFSRGTKNDPGGTFYDICGLYTKVLCDLWEADKGLNDGAEIVNIDLSNAPGELSDGQKEAIVYMFMREMQKKGEKVNGALSMTMEELKENGYLTAAGGSDDLYMWENGVSLSITDYDYGEDQAETYGLPVVHFNATKWRSPLGAYVFHDCKAAWPQMGTWSDYSIGSEMIS